LSFLLSVLSGSTSVISVLLMSWGLGRHLNSGPHDQSQTVVQGFLILHVVLMAAHCVVPLSSWGVRVVVGLLAVTGLVRGGRIVLRPRRIWLMIVGLSLVIVALATVTVSNYDAGFYYHSTIAHLRGDNVVIGLANLHHRLGNWSGSLSLAAFLESGPWGGDGYRLANPLLILVVLIAAAPRVLRVLEGRQSTGDVVAVVAVPLCLAEFLGSPGFFVAAPTPDTGFSLIAVLAIAALVDVIVDRSDLAVAELLTWSSLALIYRPTGLVLVLLAAVVLVYALTRLQLARLARVASLAALGALAHFGMTVALTGFPVFPVSALPEIVSWSVPHDMRAYQVRIVQTIARAAGQQAVETDGWSWVGPWITRNRRFTSEVAVLLSAGLAMLCFGRHSRRLGSALLAIGVVALPVGFWFWSAPDPRFGHGLVYAWAVLPLALAVNSLVEGSRLRPVALLAAGVVLSIALTASITSFLSRDLSNDLGGDAHVGTPKQIVLEAEGLVVTRPRADPGCGAALWCTPEDVSGLRVGNWRLFTVLSRD